MPSRKAAKTDSPLPPELQAQLKDYIARGYKYLKLKQGSPAKKVQEAILAAIKEVYSGKKKLNKEIGGECGRRLGLRLGTDTC